MIKMLGIKYFYFHKSIWNYIARNEDTNRESTDETEIHINLTISLVRSTPFEKKTLCSFIYIFVFNKAEDVYEI